MQVRLVRAGVAIALVCLVGGCGGSSAAGGTPRGTPRAAPVASLSLAGVRVIPRVGLLGGHATRLALPAGGGVVSFDVARSRPQAALDVSVGPRTLVINGTLPLRAHIEIADGHVAVNGRTLATGWPAGGALALRQVRWSSRVSALIISPASEPAALLLHRLAELHARLAPGQFPIGATVKDVLHNSATYWTSGFWPGALWQAAALEPAGGMFARWALAATLAHLGHERDDTHDVGFMYEQSSLAAYMALCLKGPKRVALCSRLRRSVIAASNELLALAATNSRAGTIPTNSYGPDADSIVDSMMNIAILPWATRLTGNPRYARVAARHAGRIAALLVRRDGSTIQAVNFDRATGRVVSFATHQGISARSTWSRGEGWALYGFARRRVGIARPGAFAGGFAARRLRAGASAGRRRAAVGLRRPSGRAGRRLGGSDHGGRAAPSGGGVPAARALRVPPAPAGFRCPGACCPGRFATRLRDRRWGFCEARS